MRDDKVHILYVEDDEYLAFVTRDNLEIKGYAITHCTRAEQALEVFVQGGVDLCILDIMLPGMDGFTLAEKIRKNDQHVPILFLTARSMKEDKLNGFRTGADDYITKPFSIEELSMRIEVFLKRNKIMHEPPGTDALNIGLYHLHGESRQLHGPGGSVKLTHRECDLLTYLVRHANERLKREQILKALWENDDYFSGRSLDVFISRLRKYLRDDPAISLENIHGVGFCLSMGKQGDA